MRQKDTRSSSPDQAPIKAEAPTTSHQWEDPTTFARRLRGDMTDAEKTLWTALRDRRLAAHKFRRQVPIGRYIVDFASYSVKLVIELDGGYHQAERDVRRDQDLRRFGYKVLRFRNEDITREFGRVMSDIGAAIDLAGRMG